VTIILAILVAFGSFFLIPPRVYANICTSDCIPLMDMTGSQKYQNETGGLYGNYQNNPPAAHAQKLSEARSQITSRDGSGNPSSSGKIVLLTMGMSNTRRKSDAFIGQAANDNGVSSKVVIVNGARGSVVAEKWANGENWDYVTLQLTNSGVTSAQVQAIWMLHANFAPQDGSNCTDCLAEGGEYVSTLAEHQRIIIDEIGNRFPNAKIIFFSNRTYGGYATKDLNDEPYAYESAIAARRVILDQINGTNAKVYYSNGPVLAWGPYLWADDGHANSEGLSWFSSDFETTDGTHPIENVAGKGAEKAAAHMLKFFKTNIYAASWFTGSASPPSVTVAGKPGDANGDGKADGLDYVIWLNNYNKTVTNGSVSGDFDGNGKVDGLDYVIWLSNY